MKNWKTYTLAAMVVTAAGFAYVNNSHRNMPADLRDAPLSSGILDSRFSATEKDNGTIPVPKAPVAAETGASDKGYVVGNDPSAGVPSKPIEWVTISGGKFMMGTDSAEEHLKDAKPVHEVAIKTFQMAKTDVTVEQYAECVRKGACTEPDSYDTYDYCNWDKPGRQLHPVNCVDWNQADQYAKFKGARLPSESEWEYAAKSGGKNQKYPWGNDEPNCDKAVMYGNGGEGCGVHGTMPVCSKPAGNTKIEGLPADKQLCDMAGNVRQWVQDKYQESYKGLPADGSASKTGFYRVMRGGTFNDREANHLWADHRYVHDPVFRGYNIGFRLAR